MIDLKFKYKELLDELNSQINCIPEIAIVLGSGLGNFAEKVKTIKSIPTSSLSNYPKSTVQGHEGYIHLSEYEEKKILLFQGRIHPYEGYKLSECILPAFIAEQLKVKHMLITNAAGGVSPNFEPGDLMIINSFFALNLKKELSQLFGVASVKQKHNFLNFPSKKLLDIIKTASLEEKVFMKEGTYWFGKGPSYETPAEIQMYAKLGIDAVGMSTVHEATYAAAAGLEVAAISTITNLAAGISPTKLSHDEVIETSNLVENKFERLVKRIISLL